ncbi:hypothetical protein PHLCEN_2v9132 [Hermanssonia centrifuga]|uniref:Nudix hydrolase domain-containing protein n=1 Tax=Hermanssonia centrifuga TaxID=98765 RepID=A0A2R6NSC1_9APHY|nr:hypothetical protein PHLCEN_2v9132 [Hermanssonia centrifuga]
MANLFHGSSTHLAGNFVISAGSVLCRRVAETDELQICLIYQRKRKQWLLPKGRKDCGESIEAAALRETYEETGYLCELVPLRMPTRATTPADQRNAVTIRDDCSEPMAVSVQERGKKGFKVIWWYVSRLKGGADKVEGTQMESEDYESQFVEASSAVKRLSLRQHHDIAAQALELVLSTETAEGKKII